MWNMALDDIKLASIAEISYLFTFGKYEFFQLIRGLFLIA